MNNREDKNGSGQGAGKSTVGKAKTGQDLQPSLAASFHEE